MLLRSILSKILFLFLFVSIFNLNSVPILLKYGETTLSPDSEYIIEISKIIFSKAEPIDIRSIKNLAFLKTNYSDLEIIRNSSGIKNLNNFKVLLSYCQNLVDLRKEIIKKAKDHIDTLKSGFKSEQAGLKIQLPNEAVDNEVVKSANAVLMRLEGHIQNANNLDIYIPKEKLEEALADLADAKNRIDMLLSEVMKLNIEYAQKFSQLDSSLKAATEQLRKLEEYKKENPQVGEKISVLQGNLEEKIKKFEELKRYIEEHGALSEEQKRELVNLTKGSAELKEEISGEITTQLKLYEEQIEEGKKLQEELRKKSGQVISKEEITTSTEKNQQRYDEICKFILELKNSNLFKEIAACKQRYKEANKSISAFNALIQTLEQKINGISENNPILKKLKEKAAEKIALAKEKQNVFTKNLEENEVVIQELFSNFDVKKTEVDKLTELPEIDFSKKFIEDQVKILNEAEVKFDRAQEYKKALDEDKEKIDKILISILELGKEVLVLIQDAQAATEVEVLTEQDKQFIQEKVTEIIEEESNNACLPYNFKLDGNTERSIIPESGYVEAGKPKPAIAVVLDIQNSKLVEKIKKIEFTSEQKSKNIYTKLLGEELEKLIKENVLDKKLDYVYRNIIVKYPLRKQGQGKHDAIQCGITQIFDGFVKDFDNFFDLNILNLGIILTHIKSMQINSEKQSQDEEASGVSVLKKFHRIIKDETASLEEMRFYINGLRIDPSFGCKDDEFFKFRTSKGPDYFNLRKQDGPFPIINSVALPFVLGGYYDFGQNLNNHLKNSIVNKLISNESISSNYKELIDAFFTRLGQILFTRFSAEKIKAFDHLNKIFILSNITDLTSLSFQIRNLATIYSLEDDHVKKEELKIRTVSVTEILGELKELIDKENGSLDGDSKELTKKLALLKEKLKSLNDFIIDSATLENVLNSCISAIEADILNQLKNKYGELDQKQQNLLARINKVKEEFRQNFNVASLNSTWKVDELKKDTVINYFSAGSGKLELLDKKDIIKDQFFGRISSLPNLFISGLYSPDDFSTLRLRNFANLSFFKYNVNLIPVESLYSDLLSGIRTKRDLLENFSYQNVHSFFESTGFILTQLDFAYESDDPNNFFNTNEYKTTFAADMLAKLKVLSVTPTTRLQEDLKFIQARISKSEHYSDYKKIFNREYPSPKYFLSLAKKYFENNKFEKMTKSLFTYFYISNELFHDTKFRLFDWDERVELKVAAGRKEQVQPQPGSLRQAPTPPPGLFGPSLLPGAPGGIVAKPTITTIDIKTFKTLTDENFFKRYDINIESLNKFYVERFYLTIINFLKLVVKKDLQLVVSSFESFKQGRFIKDIFPNIESGSFDIKNQQLSTLKLMRDIPGIVSFVNALNVLAPKIELNKQNVLTVSFESEFDFTLAIHEIELALRAKLVAKYPVTKGFYVEEKEEDQEKPKAKKLTDVNEIGRAIEVNLINFVVSKLKEYLSILTQYQDLKIDLNEWKTWNLTEKSVFRPLQEAEEKRLKEELTEQAEEGKLAKEAQEAEAAAQDVVEQLKIAKENLLQENLTEEEKKRLAGAVKLLEKEKAEQKIKEAAAKKKQEDARVKRDAANKIREEAKKKAAEDEAAREARLKALYNDNKSEINIVINYFVDVIKAMHDKKFFDKLNNDNWKMRMQEVLAKFNYLKNLNVDDSLSNTFANRFFSKSNIDNEASSGARNENLYHALDKLTGLSSEAYLYMSEDDKEKVKKELGSLIIGQIIASLNSTEGYFQQQLYQKLIIYKYLNPGNIFYSIIRSFEPQ